MSLSEQIRQKLIATFQAEQREHLQTMTQALLALEQEPGSPSPAVLDELFRAAHSMKGSARVVGLTAVESLAHALEELLMGLRDGRLSFTRTLFDLFYQSLDAAELLLAQAETGDTTPPAKVLALLARLENFAEEQRSEGAEGITSSPHPLITSSPHPFLPSSPDETIRVSVSKLDGLMAGLGELVAAKIRAEQRLSEARQMRDMAEGWQKEWLALRSQYHRLRRADFAKGNGHFEAAMKDKRTARDLTAVLEFVNNNQEQLRYFTAQTNALYRQSANDLMRLSLAIDELETEMKRVRLLPLATITTPFRRLVRDLGQQQGKQVSLTIIGDEMEMDRRLLEQVKDPLIHLLRNAVDHGVEATAVRQQSGKPARATVTLTAVQQANNILITVSDDGAGLNLAVLREAAVQKGILSPIEAANLNDGAAANLVFRSGLSTSLRVTAISGRGVGLDVVRQNVAELNGSLSVSSEPGKGTTFSLLLPLTLASSRGLLLTAAGQTFALPITAVERMIRIKPEEITNTDGKATLFYQDNPVPLAQLADLLELKEETVIGNPLSVTRSPITEYGIRNTEYGLRTVVILTIADKHLGLIVDTLDGEQEIVIKPLGSQLVKVGGFMGATTLGSGQVVLVLHAADLLKLAIRNEK
jgi:two-component system chemotaxis sensor kinase CheA